MKNILRFVILGLLISMPVILYPRVTHLKGEIWVGWRDDQEADDFTINSKGDTQINLINHTALDIGNYKLVYSHYGDARDTLERVTIGAEKSKGGVAYTTAWERFWGWSSEKTEHHIDIWKIWYGDGRYINNPDRIISWCKSRLSVPYAVACPHPWPEEEKTSLWDTTSFYCHKFVWWAFADGGNIGYNPNEDLPAPYHEFPVYQSLPYPHWYYFAWVTARDLTHNNPWAIEIYHDFVPNVVDVSSPGHGGIVPIANGCPYLYVWNGEGFLKENSLLPASVICDTSVYDYYLISNEPSTENGIIKLKIKEYESEKTSLDQVRLLVIDHYSPGVAVSGDGNVMCYDEIREPISCVDNHGNDCLQKILYNDSLFWEGEDGDYIELTFYNHWLRMGLLASLPKKEEGNISIFGNPANLWDLYSRGDYNLVLTDISEVERDSFVTIRIYSHGHARLNFVSCVRLTDETPMIRVYAPISAMELYRGDVRDEICERDGRSIELYPGDELELQFSTPEGMDSLRRDYVILTNGRYDGILPRVQLVDVLDTLSKLGLTDKFFKKGFEVLLEAGRSYWWNDNTSLADSSYGVFNYLRHSVKFLKKGGVVYPYILRSIVDISKGIALLAVSKTYREGIPEGIQRQIIRAFEKEEMNRYEASIKEFGKVWKHLGKGMNINDFSSPTTYIDVNGNGKEMNVSYLTSRLLNVKLITDKVGEYSMEIIDVSGRVVKKVFDRHFEKGEYNLNVDVHELPDGVYFVRMRGEDTTEMIKVSILR